MKRKPEDPGVFQTPEKPARAGWESLYDCPSTCKVGGFFYSINPLDQNKSRFEIPSPSPGHVSSKIRACRKKRDNFRSFPTSLGLAGSGFLTEEVSLLLLFYGQRKRADR